MAVVAVAGKIIGKLDGLSDVKIHSVPLVTCTITKPLFSGRTAPTDIRPANLQPAMALSATMLVMACSSNSSSGSQPLPLLSKELSDKMYGNYQHNHKPLLLGVLHEHRSLLEQQAAFRV